ncbi:MAG TPA: VanZ family protein [Candidatus Eisenbergiella merdipullorum]|uniref:VanZ family protein n=1 Tax=Candidatus Eisenbergiella merdipullorum TaxID=2838553 RepID=A0A9D2KYF5_9FIRM|nr:VanZ family protein [Candidatus Eisenbergiella merdipullorum]
MDKREKWAAAVSWFMFFFLLAVICVLSFQSGDATKALEKPFVTGVTGTADRQLSKETILTITFYIRQAGRAVLFFALGLSGGCGVFLSFRRFGRPATGAMACAVLFGISYFTEKMKIFIEGRHYAFAECLESFVFAVLGYFFASAAFLLWRRRKEDRGR